MIFDAVKDSTYFSWPTAPAHWCMEGSHVLWPEPTYRSSRLLTHPANAGGICERKSLLQAALGKVMHHQRRGSACCDLYDQDKHSIIFFFFFLESQHAESHQQCCYESQDFTALANAYCGSKRWLTLASCTSVNFWTFCTSQWPRQE